MFYSRLRQRASVYLKLSKLLDQIEKRRKSIPFDRRRYDEELDGLYQAADRQCVRFKQLS